MAFPLLTTIQKILQEHSGNKDDGGNVNMLSTIYIPVRKLHEYTFRY
jgi:hypothetical protein